MKKLAKLLVLTAIGTAAVAAHAQTYGEIGYAAVTYKEQGFGTTVESSPKALRGLIGHEIVENVALEAMAGFGIGESSVVVAGYTTPITLKIDNLFGVYVTPKFKMNENITGFIRAGYAYSEGTMSYNGRSQSASTSDFSYGLGARFALDKNTSLSVDYMSYFNKANAKATGLTFGIGFKF